VIPGRAHNADRLPNIDRADARGARAVSNNLRFENNFYVLPLPIARYLLQRFGKKRKNNFGEKPNCNLEMRKLLIV
jgi:hypothetical protein